jgi:hypothetical protein
MFIADALPEDKVKGLLNKKTNFAPAPISGSISSSSILHFIIEQFQLYLNQNRSTNTKKTDHPDPSTKLA